MLAIGRALGVALLLAAASAFIPAPIAPRHDLRGVAAPVAARRHLLAPALRMQADSSMQEELLAAAAASRAELQASGVAADVRVPTLASLAADRDNGAGLEALRSMLAVDFAASIEDDVYAAPEPLFKMLPKGADRTAQRVASFAFQQGEDQVALSAEEVRAVASSGVGLADFSHSGIIAVTGADRFRFVNGLCTNKVLDAKPGQVIASCFTTKLGRCVDLTSVAVLHDSILILCSASRCQHLYQAMDALIFPKDDVQIEDMSLAFARFQVVGPEATPIVAASLDGPCALPSPQQLSAWGESGLLIAGSGLASPGYTILVPASSAAASWRHLSTRLRQLDCPAARLLGSNEWEILRVLQGVPAPDKELTNDYNPLEAALWHTVSFDKGCYLGQETIARLKTYDGIKQSLFGISFGAVGDGEEAALSGAKLFVAQEVCTGQEGGGEGGVVARGDGKITSVVRLDGAGCEVQALGYVRVKSGAGVGSVVLAKGEGLPDEGVKGTLCDLDFARRSVADSSAADADL